MSSLAQRYFASVDGRDADALAAFFTPDARFRYGNGDVERGPDAIRSAVEAFWAAVPAVSHRFVAEWEVDGATIAELEVTYERQDGQTLTLPSTTIMRHDGEHIDDLRVYMDVAPVFA